MSAPEWLLAWGAPALLAAGLALGVYALVASADSPAHRAFERHAAELDRHCRLLYLRVSGRQIAQRQLLVLAAVVVAALALEEFFATAALGAAAALGPRLWLAARVSERRQKVDAQLDAFLTTLANALRASPSLGEALATTANLMRAPIKEDLEFALKEHKLGTPLDQALLNMAGRIDSRALASALGTILIGRQTGGDLPKILERSAATLREMARLEGVVRSKTAEGRAQAWVLGAVPFVIIGALNFVDPTWLDPLRSSAVGYAIVAIAAGLWVGAIFAARRILNVDV